MFSQFFASLQQDAKLFLFFPHPMRPLSGYFHQGSTARTPILRGRERFSGTPFVTVFGGAWTLTPMFS